MCGCSAVRVGLNGFFFLFAVHVGKWLQHIVTGHFALAAIWAVRRGD